MKRKLPWIYCIVLSCVLVLVACESEKETSQVPPDGKVKETLENGAEISLEQTSSEPSAQAEERMEVALLGEAWDEFENVTFAKTTWQTKIPKSIRFILINDKEKISQENQVILQNWIKEDKVVLFYGENVQPEEVKEKINMEIGVIQVESDASFDFPYLLYGYGYSKTYEQYLPIFLGSNASTDVEKKIANFLVKNKNF